MISTARACTAVTIIDGSTGNPDLARSSFNHPMNIAARVRADLISDGKSTIDQSEDVQFLLSTCRSF